MPNELEKLAETVDASPTQEKSQKEIEANLDKAIDEAKAELKRVREEIKIAKSVVVEEELPQIDMSDPSARAWDKRIQDSSAPISSQLEKQKEEVRSFALRKFLVDKPSLANNPEKLKEFMQTYDRIKVATEQTQEGVLMDFDKTYGAVFHEELISAARSGRLDQAKQDMILSDIAISRGATSETSQVPVKRPNSAEDQRIIDTWELNGAPKVD